jgi:sporulation protein YlmC with PRC-barrel domain
MEVEYGSEVIDSNGKSLGTVNYVMRNTWTGEISKFIVRREAPERDLFVSVQDGCTKCYRECSFSWSFS